MNIRQRLNALAGPVVNGITEIAEILLITTKRLLFLLVLKRHKVVHKWGIRALRAMNVVGFG